jgi:hypothetical protein
MRQSNFLGKMDEEIPMTKSRFTEAQIMGVLRQAEGHAEQHLHRRASLDGGIAKGPRPPAPALRRASQLISGSHQIVCEVVTRRA